MQSLQKLNSLLVKILAVIGQGVLILMMLLTAADVCLRYIFNRPILGALELTEFMMAIVVSSALAYAAFRKGHVSVDVLITRFSSRVQAVINSITCFLGFSLFLLIAWRSTLYAENLRACGQVSTILYIPIHPFVYSIIIGSAVICLILLGNLVEHLRHVVERAHWRVWVGSLSIVVLVLVLFMAPIWGQGMIWQVSPLMSGVLGIVVLVILLFSGMPVGITMALMGFLGMAYVNGLSGACGIIGSAPYTNVSKYSYTVIPLFVLMGSLCFHAGLSRDLYFTIYKWLGRLPGGLAMATVGACAGFAAVSGSSVATASTMGTVALPEMKKYRYDDRLATGSIAAGGTIGILIPPSIALVLYGILTEQSIGKLFLAGFIPGILEAVFYIITIYILCWRNPSLGPRGPSTTLKEKIVSLKNTWGVLALFLLVVGGIYLGIFTPTEAAGIGAFGAIIFALIRRRLNWQNFTGALAETGETAGMALLILIGGVLFGYFLAVTRLPFEMSTIVAGLQVSRYVILGCIILIYLFLGAIMSVLAAIILTVPIFFPVIMALGFNPIWFGILIVRLMEIGQITPPVGVNVFVIKGIAKDVPLYTIFRGIIPFLIADLCHVALLIAIPQIVLFLPNMMR